MEIKKKTWAFTFGYYKIKVWLQIRKVTINHKSRKEVLPTKGGLPSRRARTLMPRKSPGGEEAPKIAKRNPKRRKNGTGAEAETKRAAGVGSVLMLTQKKF